MEWFRRVLLANDRSVEPARLARLEERFEQLRTEAEKQGFQDIEGIVDPVLIRLKVQDARQRLMDACYEGTKRKSVPPDSSRCRNHGLL